MAKFIVTSYPESRAVVKAILTKPSGLDPPSNTYISSICLLHYVEICVQNQSTRQTFDKPIES